jgi:biopolymer transport protein ExbD
MKTFVDNEPADIRIEIIPLVDVVFCVLTFFILAAIGLTRIQGIGINLPQTQSSSAKFGDKLALQVNSVGEIFVKNEIVTETDLIQKLTDFRRGNPAGLIVIDADRQASYEKVVQLLDLLQALNIDKVALGAIEQPTGNPPFNLQPNAPTQQPNAPNQTTNAPSQPPSTLTDPVLPPSSQPDTNVGTPPPGQPPLIPINPGTSNGASGR